MASKRKAGHMDDSDDEDMPLGRQILPVANLPGDFDGEPEDGLQYLFTVRREFHRLPHITRVSNPYELPPAPAPPQRPTPSHLPSPAWRAAFEKHFLNLRSNLPPPTSTPTPTTPNTTRAALPDKKDRARWWAFLAGRPAGEWDPPRRPAVDRTRRWQHGREPLRAADGWTPVQHPAAPELAPELIAVGTAPEMVPVRAPEAAPVHGAPQMWRAGGGAFATPETYSVSAASAPPAPAPPAAVAVKLEPAEHAAVELGSAVLPYRHVPPEPTPRLLDLIDHRYAVHVLMYLTHWITLHLEHVSAPPPPDQGAPGECASPHPIALAHLRWAFVLLARVEPVPSADETAQLRALSRACVELIKTPAARPDGAPAADDRAFVAACWMVVAAVAGVWAQRDLWMDAEEALAAA